METGPRWTSGGPGPISSRPPTIRDPPNRVLAMMAGNVVLDVALGSVPVLGDLLDIGLKANRRNARLLRRHFERQGVAAPAGI
jgi:hypothetical protein